MTTTDLDPPVAREEPSQKLAAAAFYTAAVGCAGVTMVASVVMAVIVLRRGRRTGDDHGWGVAVAALLIDTVWLALIGLLILFNGGGQHHTNPLPPGSVTSDQLLSVDDLRTGDCYDDSDVEPGVTEAPGFVVSDVTIEPCTEPHQAQVFTEYPVDAGEDFPGQTFLDDSARIGCAKAFTTYVGIPPTRSHLRVGYLVPVASSWRDAEDRTITCVVSDPAGKTTGSLRNAAR